jgi:hypothetical protein
MKVLRKKIKVFDGKPTKSGGHSQWLSKVTKLDYLTLEFGLWRFHYDHFYYDGQHHALHLGLIRIFWGGFPFKDEE